MNLVCFQKLPLKMPLILLLSLIVTWNVSKFYLNLCWSDTIYQPLRSGQDMTQGQFFKRSLTGLNSEFSFS